MDEHLMQEVPPELQVIPPAERVDASPYLNVPKEHIDHYRECIVHYFDNQMNRDILMLKPADKHRMFKMLEEYADVLEKIFHSGIPILEHIQGKCWDAARRMPHKGINFDHDCPIIREYDEWKNVQNSQETIQQP